MIRTWRNRLLRLKVIKTTDMARAAESEWTWGAEGPDATEAWISPLSILHDVADAFGFHLYLELPDDPDGRVPASDPRWDTDAKLVITNGLGRS